MNAAIETAIVDLAERLRRSTVAVRTRSGNGSGIVWDTAGTIVTNAHVVNARRAEVVLGDGRRYVAQLVARDQQHDLAILKIRADGLVAAETRDAMSVRVGEVLVALGHPHGVPNALAFGIAATRSDRFVRADLALAPGNSGGPMADAHGRVVGVASMVANGRAMGIPTETVRAYLTYLAASEARAA